MAAVRIVHCADLHIGAAENGIGEKSQARRLEALLTFENIIKLARDNAADILLIAGDLFCSNNVSSQEVTRVLDCIGSIPGIKVVFAAGNHDPLNADSPFKRFKLPDNLYVLPEKDSVISFEDLGVKVYGRSFSEVYLQGERRFSLEPAEDSINIMCQHGEVRADISSNYNSITTEFIDNCGMDYIALGHIHKRSEIMRRGNTYFAYCGCAEGLGFDELGDKGVYVGEVDKGFADLKFYKTSIRTHERVAADVSDCEDNPSAAVKIISVLSEKYGAAFADNLYKIELCGNVPDGRWFDTAEIAGRLMQTVYFAKVKDKTEVASDLDTIKNENSLKGIFVSNMLALIKEKPDEADKLRAALNIGLKAFSSEVAYNED
ncbi:MAG: DNA repair exonuclease [Clostridia bacterium]|nr:DNA repair exonuclease [Clostridia bacterium]